VPAERVFLARAPSQYPQHAPTSVTGQGLPPPPSLATDVSSRMHQTRQVNLLRELLSGYAAVQWGKRRRGAVAGVLLGLLLGLVGGLLVFALLQPRYDYYSYYRPDSTGAAVAAWVVGLLLLAVPQRLMLWRKKA